jgi:hypothetical protein
MESLMSIPDLMETNGDNEVQTSQIASRSVFLMR